MNVEVLSAIISNPALFVELDTPLYRYENPSFSGPFFGGTVTG